MATKKFRCKVCGYVHEGDKAPAKCPVCQAPASEFEEVRRLRRVWIVIAMLIPLSMRLLWLSWSLSLWRSLHSR